MAPRQEDNRNDNATREEQLDNAREIQTRNNTEPPPDATTERDVQETVQQEAEEQPPIIVPEGEDVTRQEESSLADNLTIDESLDEEQQVAETRQNLETIQAEIERTVSPQDTREVSDIVETIQQSVTTENVSQIRDAVQQAVERNESPQQALRTIAEETVRTVEPDDVDERQAATETVERVERLSIVGPAGPPLITPRVQREVPRVRPRRPDQERLQYGQRDRQRVRETANSLIQFTDDLKTMNYILKKFNPITEANLFTAGGEFIDYNFREYVGPYHKHMDGTLMQGEGKVGLSHKVNARETLVKGGPFTDPELLAGRRSYVPPEIVADVSVERSRRRAARRRGERPGSFESRVEGLRERPRDPRDALRSIGPPPPRRPGSSPPGYGRQNDESRPPLIDPGTREIERRAERILEQNDRDEGITPPGREVNTERVALEPDTRDERSQAPGRTSPPIQTESPGRTTPPDREDSREQPREEDSREQPREEELFNPIL